MKVNELTHRIIGAAMEVHTALGPGLLESAYQVCLLHELTIRGLSVEAEQSLPLVYKGLQIGAGYRIDLIVEQQIIVELKSIERIEPIHEAQLLSYLRLSGCHVGLLINFNVRHLKSGIRRMVNGAPEELLASSSASPASSVVKSPA